MNDDYALAKRLHSICPDLAAHIARCTEQAYRRGYQQGATYGHGLDRQISDWRFISPKHLHDTSTSAKYNHAPEPPDRRNLGLHKNFQKPPVGASYGLSSTSLERLSWEAASASSLISTLTNLALERFDASKPETCPHCHSWLTPDNPEPQGPARGCLQCIDKL